MWLTLSAMQITSQERSQEEGNSDGLLLKGQLKRESMQAAPAGTVRDTNPFSQLLVALATNLSTSHSKLEKSFYVSSSRSEVNSQDSCSHCPLHPVPERRAHSWSIIPPIPLSVLRRHHCRYWVMLSKPVCCVQLMVNNVSVVSSAGLKCWVYLPLRK